MAPLLLTLGTVAYHVYGCRDTDPLLLFFVATTVPGSALGLLMILIRKIELRGEWITVSPVIGPSRRICVERIATSIWMPSMRVTVDVTTRLLVLLDPHGAPILRLKGRRFPMAELGGFAMLIKTLHPQTELRPARAGAVSAACSRTIPWNLRHPHLYQLGLTAVALVAQVAIMLALS